MNFSSHQNSTDELQKVGRKEESGGLVDELGHHFERHRSKKHSPLNTTKLWNIVIEKEKEKEKGRNGVSSYKSKGVKDWNGESERNTKKSGEGIEVIRKEKATCLCCGVIVV